MRKPLIRRDEYGQKTAIWGGITEYTLDGGTVTSCYAYRLHDDEWERVELEPDGRRQLHGTSGVPDDWVLAGVAENHPEYAGAHAEAVDPHDRSVVAVFAAPGGGEWGCVELEPSAENYTDE